MRLDAALIPTRLPGRQDSVHVGYRLYREVRDFAPPGLTSGELVVAWVIADDANDNTRHSWIENAELCCRTRMRPSTVRANLAKLADRGLEFRVIHGYDKNGSPVFAAKGHASDYVVPDFFKAASGLAPSDGCGDAEGASAVAALSPSAAGKGASAVREGASAVAALSPKGASRLAPLPSEDLNHLTIPSVDRPAVTTSVEGVRATGQVKTPDFAASIQDAARSLPPVKLTQQEEFERQAAGLRLIEMQSLTQESE